MSKYILLKDTINYSTGYVIAAGEVFEPVDGKDFYRSKNGWVMSEAAVKNTDFFKEDKPERIEVKNVVISPCPYPEWGSDYAWYSFALIKPIDQNILPLVKYHIEMAINTKLKPAHSGDVNIEDCKIGTTLYTQEQLNKAKESGFIAGGENIDGGYISGTCMKYPTIISYMESLKNKS